MKITKLDTELNGVKSYEIRASEIAFSRLVCCIKRIPGVVVKEVANDLMNDDAKIYLEYKGVEIEIDAPFSDYILNCKSGEHAFEEFVEALRRCERKWWNLFIG